MNDVLKGIITQLIEGAYSYIDEEKEDFTHIYRNKSHSKKETLKEAPEKLIQLANQLQLGNVNKESISEYFKIQERYNFDKKVSSDNKEFSSYDVNRMMFSLNGNNDLILKLIDSYSSHLKYLDTFLNPYEYLVANFNNFFKNKNPIYIKK